MTSVLTPMCYSCLHLRTTLPDGTLPCAAFPYGIPDEILEGQTDHRQSIEGDDGIVFAQDSDLEIPLFEMYPFSQPQPVVSALRIRVHGQDV